MKPFALILAASGLALTACGESATPESAAATDAQVFQTSSTVEAEVEGMHCGGCEASMCAVLQGLPGVAAVKADHEAGRVTLALEEGAELDAQTLADAILDARPDYKVGEVFVHSAGEAPAQEPAAPEADEPVENDPA